MVASLHSRSALLDPCSESALVEIGAQALAVPAPGPERLTLARLLDSEIDRMERDELIELIRRADLPLCRGSLVERLPCQSTDELRRIAYLIRRCCQNQLNAFCAARRLPLRYKAVI